MDIENILSRYSDELLAIFSGIVIIFTIYFFLTVVVPLWSEKSSLVIFSLITLIVGVIIPLSFYISDVTVWPDPVGKMITGISIAIFLILVIHISLSYGTSNLGEVLFSGLLGLSSSLLLVRGVLVPMMGVELEYEGSIEEENFEVDDHETNKDEEEPDLFKEETEDEKFIGEEDEPW